MEEKKEMAKDETPEKKKDEPKKKVGWWQKKTFAGKLWFIVFIIILTLVVTLFLLWANVRSFGNDEVANILLGVKEYKYDELGNVIGTTYFQNGWERIGQFLIDSTYKFVFALVVLTVGVTLFFIVKVIVLAIKSKADRKGKTMASLLLSCIKYIDVLVCVGIIVTIFGVDVASVVAGVGVVTLIIGLGCQSLIQDVVSGIFIVFDDFFSVGDIVIVDGFRGEIVGIGLNSTRLLDPAGNYKTIHNSKIGAVTNLSRLPSLFTIAITIDYREDIDRVESIVLAGLEEINANNPKLTSPLTYGGIDGFDEKGVRLFFLGYCHESDRFQCGRDVNHDLYVLLKRNNVAVGMSQVVVSSPVESVEKASEDERKTLSKKRKESREKPTETQASKKGFFRGAKDAVEQASRASDGADDL